MSNPVVLTTVYAEFKNQHVSDSFYFTKAWFARAIAQYDSENLILNCEAVEIIRDITSSAIRSDLKLDLIEDVLIVKMKFAAGN